MAESSVRPETNRRQAPRFPCTGAVEISQSGSRWGWGRVNDLSAVGCYVESVQLLSVGTEVQLRITVADASLDIAAKVASNDPGTGMGMEFKAVSQEQKSQLAQIVKSIAATESPASPKTELLQPSATTHKITREEAPAILAKIIKQMNEKGVLTRQDLVDIVKSNKER